jgi:hypothetical protein
MACLMTDQQTKKSAGSLLLPVQAQETEQLIQQMD